MDGAEEPCGPPSGGLNSCQPSGLYELSFWLIIEFRTQNVIDCTTMWHVV